MVLDSTGPECMIYVGGGALVDLASDNPSECISYCGWLQLGVLSYQWLNWGGGGGGGGGHG